jgi:hypothetical protein
VTKRLVPSKDAHQEKPRRSYVYAHVTANGKYFYIGKGTGDRAWSADSRHSLWYRYVRTRLKGEFSVLILQDNLSSEESEGLESEWIAQCSDTLVNWFNMGRATDLEALDKHNRLRDANRSLIQKAKAIEKCNLEQAAAMYVQAIESIRAYAFISYDKGLIGQLLEEEAAEFGTSGEIEAIDRLSMCLIKIGKPEDAARHADSYFALYRRDLHRPAVVRIAKRIEKARVRMRS